MEVTDTQYKESEIGIIPVDWEVKKLFEISDLATGNTPPTNDPTNYGDEFLFVSPADLGKGKWITQTEKKLSKRGFSISRKFPKNSILFTCIGSTIGKSGMAELELTSNQQINAVIPSSKYSNDFIFYALDYISPRIKLLAGEQAVPIVNKTLFGETLLAVPPTKSEQTAIATALSNTDALIENLEKLISKKRNIKQGVMQELLKPKSTWVLTSIGEVAKICKGEQLNKDTLFSQGQYPVMNGGIQPSGYSDKWNQNKNTIIISEGGNSCGYVNFIKTRFWQGGHCYSVDAKIHKHFLFHLLKFHGKEIMALRVGSGLPNIQRNRLIEFSLRIPDKEKQQKIAMVLDEINEEIIAMEHKLLKYNMIKQGMMQALLTGKIRLV